MVVAPHSPQIRAILRHAGLSEQSELTMDEFSRMGAAAQLLERRPSATRDEVYRTLRPRRDDE